MENCKQEVMSLVDGTEYPPELDKEALERVIHTNNVIWREDPYKTLKLSKSKTNAKSLLKY